MSIIGKLLKKTNAITYRRSLKKRSDSQNQLRTLSYLMTKAQKTKFGLRYQFSAILATQDVVKSFQKNVPITEYETYYTDWLKDCISGAKNHIWPGKIRHYALSSGTTGSPSKRIPITNEMINSFQKSSIAQISMLHEFDLPDKFYGGQLLAVGGSSKLISKENHIEGDLSGILKKYTSFIVSPLTRPNRNITRETDWNRKLEMMVLKAPEWNISIIAGVPSWCILLMERIVAHYKLRSIHDIWPNLEVYVHGGVFIEPYMPKLNRLLGKDIILFDTYLASEGYFGYQIHPEKKGMQLLLESGVFFEFIPFNSDYFDQHGDLKNNSIAFTIDEVQPDVDYALVISTNAGLWRYLIGDLVRFTDIEQREVIITGRIKQFLSLCGEHLSLSNINHALQEATTQLNFEIIEFTIYANEEKMNHHWFISASEDVDETILMSCIEQKLNALNDDYRSSRMMNLKNPDLTIIPVSQFYAFMEMQGKLGSQYKFPRVLNKLQSADWLGFINLEN